MNRSHAPRVFGQVMLDTLKTYFTAGQIKTYYSVVEPLPGKRGYPYIVIHEHEATGGMLTSTAPQIDALYLIEIVDRYPGRTQDESAAQLVHQRCMQLADSIQEILRNDTTVRGLCLDLRGTRTEPKIAEAGDIMEIRQPVTILAVFNTNAGVYGYSLYGYAVYG